MHATSAAPAAMAPVPVPLSARVATAPAGPIAPPVLTTPVVEPPVLAPLPALAPTPALEPTPAPSELPPDAAETSVEIHGESPLASGAGDAPGPTEATDLPFDLSLDGSVQAQDLAAAAAVVDELDLPPLPQEILPAQTDAPTLRESSELGDALVAALEHGIPAEPTANGGSTGGLHARLCVSCGAAVPEGFKFCGVCGTRYEQRPRIGGPVFVPSVQDVSQAPARIIVIHPDGSEGDVFALGANETTVGRSHPSSIFSEDPFLSPRHATFYFVKGQLFARDEGSLNGVFVRIKAEVELFHGDMFRIGQQLLRFEEMAQVRPVLPGAGDGTTVMGSPLRGAWGRLASIVALNTPAAVWVLRRPEEHMGRERGEITFPEDGFVSGAHCKVSTRESRFFLRDLDSTNGSYLRVKAEGILAQGDLILLGQQLFKIDLSH